MRRLTSIIILAAAFMALPKFSFAQPDQNTIATYYSLYYEDFKNGNYESALPNLRWVLENAPEFPRKTDKNFERAVTTYKEMALATDDAEMQRALLDTALTIFDTAVPTLREKGAEVDEFEWTVKKGKFIQELPEELADLQGDVSSIYMQAYDMNPTGLDPYYINFIALDLAQRGMEDEALEFVERVGQDRGGEAEIDEIVDKIEGGLNRDPEARYERLKRKLGETPDDPELLIDFFETLVILERRDEIYEVAPRILALEPSAKTYRMLAKMKLEDGEPQEAYDMYEQSLTLPGASEYAREIHYNMGLAQRELGRLSRARTQFRKALEIDPSFGAALMGIGDLYVQAISNCGSFERDDRAVYWLATDYYERAKNADPSVAGQANTKIRQYRQYYPDSEMLFFANMSPGSSYTVSGGCYGWIGETTRVKSP